MELKRITIVNFKGIKSLDIELSGSSRISGPNGSGKTSIYDAFMWALFGTDSEERKTFTIKPVDKNGVEINRQDIEVSVFLEIDGSIQKFTKCQREKWTRKRGEEEEQYTGNETLCSINDVPLTSSQYAEHIAGIIPGERFKLVTNVYCFPTLHWSERRRILMEIAGDVGNEELLKKEPKLAEILEYDLVNYQKEITARRKKIQAEVDTIPARIDEVKRSVPEFDPKELERLRDAKADSGAEIRKQRLSLEAKLEELLSRGRKELSDLRLQERMAEAEHLANVKILQDEDNRLRGLMSRLSPQTRYLEAELAKLRDEYKSVQELKFDGKCPTCGGIMEDPSDFNLKKAKRLSELNNMGKGLRVQYDEAKSKLEEATAKLGEIVYPVQATTKVSEETFWAAYRALPEIRILEKQIRELPTESTYNAERLSYLEAIPGRIAECEARILELENRLREGHVEIAKIQRHEALIQKFWKLKVQLVDDRLGKIFPTLKFKLFKPLLNGGEEPACEILVGGVPFNDANHAAKINSGLEIIQALSEHWEIKAPVFIDNAEAVIKLAPFNGQIIALNVAKTKGITVENF